jgi:hypothetical protein
MADWLSDAFGFGDDAEPVKPKAKPTKPKVEFFVVAIRNPSGAGDLGQAIEGAFFVEHGIVYLCDHAGKPLPDAEASLKDGDDPRVIAKRLCRRRWLAANEQSAFNRPINQHAQPYGGY